MAELFIAYMFGVAVGIFVMYKIYDHFHKPVGTLRVDRSIPDEPPYYFLEIDKYVGDISRYNLVAFRVVNEDYLDSQE